MKALFLTLLVLLGLSTPAWAATTYYVNPSTGNDANDGSSESPWLTLQRCAKTVGVSPDLVAGDTCIAQNGTYMDLDGDGKIVYADANAPVGQIGLPITIKAENYLGAVLVLGHQDDANNAGDNTAFYLTKNYYVIEGFEITGDGQFTLNNGTTVDFDGITITGSTGHVIRRNKIHDIGRECVKNSPWGFNGVSMNASSTTIEYNEFYNIGRLRLNENGCSTSRTNYQNDHGIYASGTSNIFRNNIFYGDHRGQTINMYGGTTTSIQVYNNTSYGIPLDDPPRSHFLIGSVWAGTSYLKNNIFSQVNFAPYIACCTGANGITGSGVIHIDEDLTDSDGGNGADWFHGDVPTQVSGGGVGAGSQLNTDPGFVDGANANFTLAAGSAAINSGANVGFSFNGSAPDKGAFETFTYASAMVNENFLDVTLGMNLNIPVLPATGLTGFTALVGGVPRTTVSAQRLAGTDSVVRITFDGAACTGGQTWTVTYASGNATDSALIGGHLNQPLSAFTAQAVTNACGSAPPSPPGTPLITYLLDDNTGTVVDNTGSSGATDDGALTGTVAWSAGKNLYGVTMTDLVDGTVAIPYGNGVNLSTQSVTVAFWVNVPTDLIDNSRMYFGTSPGTNQRFYLVTSAGTWRLGIQSSTLSSGASNLTVAAGWNRICLVADSGTDIATLSVNGVTGTGSAAKAYTSYALASDLSLGQPFASIGNPGVTYDDFNLWTSAESCADDWAAAEPPPAPSTMVLTQKRHQFYQSHYAAGTTTKVLIGAQQAAITKFAGESFALETQTDATVAGGSVAQRLHYKRNSGAAQPVTDDCNTVDQFCFVGTGTDPTDLINESPAACLAGALTPIVGSTQITADAVPVTTFTTNSCTEHIRVLKFGAAAVPTDTYDLLEYEQTGVAFTGTPEPAGGARVTVEGATPGITAPTNLHFSGPTNSSIATLIWSPVTYVGLAAYDIFRSTTTGVYGTEPTYSMTVAGARASHSPMTQLIMRLPTADEYFFVVKARDTDGTRSAASSEVSITVTGQVGRTQR